MITINQILYSNTYRHSDAEAELASEMFGDVPDTLPDTLKTKSESRARRCGDINDMLNIKS